MANRTSKSSLSLPTILLIIFLTLKISGAIAWSWAWVLSPLWVPLVLFTALFIGGVIGLVMLIAICAIVQKGDCA